MLKKQDYKLRKIVNQDSYLIFKWRNLEHIRKNMFNGNVVEEVEHKKWFENIKHNHLVDYKIFEYKDYPVGLVYLNEIDMFNRRAFWGFYLGEQGLPKYSGLLMGILALEYFFCEYKMNKIYGEVIGYNKISLAYHKKLGFLKEGCFFEHILKDGEYHDVVRFALYNKKWEKYKQRFINEYFKC